MRGRVVKNTKVMRSVGTCAVLFFAVLSVDGGIAGAHAQAGGSVKDGTNEYDRESKDQVVRNIMRSYVKRSAGQVGHYGSEYAIGQKLELPPLPGDQAAFDSAKAQDAKKFFPGKEMIPDFGKNNRSSVNMALQPLMGFQQMADSEDFKNMFKEMVTAKVPVLFQTYMMVENGAATGYMGGLNAVSNLMANSMQTYDYNLALLDLTDDTGKMKEAYIQRIKEASKTAKSWPAALYAAVGDSADFKTVKSEELKVEKNVKPYDLKGLPSEKSDGDGGKRLLSDLLFLKNENQGNDSGDTLYSNEELDSLKAEFKRLVGDVEIELKAPTGGSAGSPPPGGSGKDGPDGWLRVLEMNFKAPEKKDERRGIALENWKEVQVVWENLNLLLTDLCEFKKSNRNEKDEPGDKETTATSKDIGKKRGQIDPWEFASAPDIPVTVNLFEQLYENVKRTKKENIDCKALNLSRDEIPTVGEASDTNIDDCGANKGCMRNRVILHMAFIIARSRTLHTYRTMYLLSKRFTTDPALSDLLDRLFIRTVSGINIDEELKKNRERWDLFTDRFAELLQGQSGAGSANVPAVANSSFGGAPRNGGAGR